MLGLSIIKLLLMIMIHSMEIYKCSCGIRCILNVELICVKNFYYYFHMPKPWEFYYPFDFHKSLQITKKSFLMSDYICHSFIKVFFFPFFSILAALCMFCVYDFHHCYLTVSKNKQSKRREKEDTQVLSVKLSFPVWIGVNYLTSPCWFLHLYSGSKFPIGLYKN